MTEESTPTLDADVSCYTCDTDCTQSRCDFIGSSPVSVSSDNQAGGFTDGTFTNATVVVSGGYITSVYSGKPFEYNPPVCGGAAGVGGGSVSNTIIINKDAKSGEAGQIQSVSAQSVPYGQPINVVNKGTPTKADLLFSFPESAPIDPSTILNSVTGSNNAVTVNSGLVTDISTGAYFITGADLVINGASITGSATIDPVNKDHLHITLDTTNIDTQMSNLMNTLEQQQASIQTLESRVSALEKSNS